MSNQTALQNIIGDYQTFLGETLEEVIGEDFNLNDFVQMDHMCYRVATTEQYEAKKAAMLSVAKLLGEVKVNGRLISSFRLNEPVIFDRWRVDTVELPAPKPGTPTAEGLEHVEFVLYDDLGIFLGKYAHKQFNMQSADRGINPEVGYKLPSGRGVKFHLLNLPTVVFLEKKLGLTDIKDN